MTTLQKKLVSLFNVIVTVATLAGCGVKTETLRSWGMKTFYLTDAGSIEQPAPGGSDDGYYIPEGTDTSGASSGSTSGSSSTSDADTAASDVSSGDDMMVASGPLPAPVPAPDANATTAESDQSGADSNVADASGTVASGGAETGYVEGAPTSSETGYVSDPGSTASPEPSSVTDVATNDSNNPVADASGGTVATNDPYVAEDPAGDAIEGGGSVPVEDLIGGVVPVEDPTYGGSNHETSCRSACRNETFKVKLNRQCPKRARAMLFEKAAHPILSVEARSPMLASFLMGSVNLHDQDLFGPRFKKQITLNYMNMPANRKGRNATKIAVFVCDDTNGNGKCSDESASSQIAPRSPIHKACHYPSAVPVVVSSCSRR